MFKISKINNEYVIALLKLNYLHFDIFYYYVSIKIIKYIKMNNL